MFNPIRLGGILRQSSLRFTLFSHFHSIPLFTFVTIVNFIEDGHICIPKFGLVLFLLFLLLLLLFYFTLL